MVLVRAMWGLGIQLERRAVSTEARGILLTYCEAGRELHCSAATVAREVAEGKLAFRLIRRRRFIHRDDLDQYLHAARCRLSPGTAEEHEPRDRVSLRAAGWDGDSHGTKAKRRR